MTDTSQAAGLPHFRRLGSFDAAAGYDRGRGVLWQAIWFAVMNLVFSRWWCPKSVRVSLLRAFGAQIGDAVVIRHGVRVLWPWKLSIADHSWIGEGTWLLNLEPITIGRDVCLSQETYLCTGSHDRRDPEFKYANRPIVIEDGAWIATQALILAGVTVGRDSVIGARAIVTRSAGPSVIVKAGCLL